jgi:D-alanyl-D-alanine carboxypeptidase/D-alanyl-D-alanine-endopeptidase (penicillin-binding protein 4)
MRHPFLSLLLPCLLAACASPPVPAPEPVPVADTDTPAEIKPATKLNAAAAIDGFRLAGLPLTTVAIDVRAADGGGPLFALNSERAMQPASVMKLLPTQAALELLGPAHRWITRVHANRAIVDGVLDGDLVIEGGGDPQFAYQDLWRLLARLRALGLRDIRGNVLIDRSLFAPVAYDPAAFDGKPERAYNAAPDALLLNAHALIVRLVPAARHQPVTLVSEPPLDGFTVEAPKLSDEPCHAPYEQLLAMPGPDRLRFGGRYPLACGERDLVFHLHTLGPVRYVGAVFRALWSQLGGRFSGTVAEGTVAAGSRELAAWTSEPLSQQIREINKQSNNAMARNLMLSMTAQRAGPPSTAAAASARVIEWMSSAGLDPSAVVLQNGSGLSREERMPAATLAALLQRAWRQPTMPEFIASLPLAGVDGTMARRFAGSPLQGSAHLKTGSLAGVASIAGYVTARSGRRMVVVCMVNHPNAQAARAAFDRLLTWVWESY